MSSIVQQTINDNTYFYLSFSEDDLKAQRKRINRVYLGKRDKQGKIFASNAKKDVSKDVEKNQEMKKLLRLMEQLKKATINYYLSSRDKRDALAFVEVETQDVNNYIKNKDSDNDKSGKDDADDFDRKRLKRLEEYFNKISEHLQID